MTAAPCWDDLAVGVRTTRAIDPVGVADFVRYAGASGDLNPLHYDPEHARASGFPSVFAQGMFHAGALASFAADWLGPENVRGFRVRFVDVVWPGDALTLAAVVAAKSEGPPERRVEVDLTCRSQTTLVAQGTAIFALR